VRLVVTSEAGTDMSRAAAAATAAAATERSVEAATP
jgi:hypothetical protein